MQPNITIKEALKKLDETAEKTLLVTDDSRRLLGTLTDGDIRRYIIRTGKLNGTIEKIFNRKPITIHISEVSNTNMIRKILLRKKIEVLPVLDDNNRIVDYLTWSQVFSKDGTSINYKKNGTLNIPVVIMAGGRGTRLKPFTQVLPKPLIPVGDKTIVEHIMDKFRSFGITKFFMLLNYKSELIKAYFNGTVRDYQIEFLTEDRFLGTVGGLSLLKDKIHSDFILSNCDVLVDTDYEKVLEFHRSNEAWLTAITAILHYRIPYGVVNTCRGGLVKSIQEKPEHSFQINTGVYVFKREVLEYIPKDKPYDMNELIEKLLEEDKKVLAYPVSEGDYIDIGQWDEYRKALSKLSSVWEDAYV